MNKYICIFIMCLSIASKAATSIPMQDNSTRIFNGASLWHDGDSLSPQTGCMFPDFLAAGDILLHPEFTNVVIINAARSGTTMANQASAIAQFDYALFAYSLFHGYGTNSIQNVLLSEIQPNGNINSNQMYFAVSNNFLAVLTTTNETANTNEGGTSATNKLLCVAISDPAGVALNGGGSALQSDWARMTGSTNAVILSGGIAFNLWDPLFQVTSNWVFLGDSPSMRVDSGPKIEHLTSLGQAVWISGYWIQQQGSDTNISNALLDYATAGIVGTNHCVVSSVSKVGTIFSWTRTNLRLPPVLDIAGQIDWLGNVTTNDASALQTLWPTAWNFFQYTIGISNLPVGQYQLTENGVSMGVFSNTDFAGNGLNLATNRNGPCYKQRVETLGRYRDVENANRTNLIVSAGAGIPLIGSLAFSLYPTHHGDELESQMDSAITTFKTLMNTVRVSAQPTNYVYSLTQVFPNGVPMPWSH